MLRHYVKNRKFLLRAAGCEPLTVGPNAFVDIPEAYQGDPTYLLAVKAGDIQPFTTAKQGAKIEEKAEAEKKAPKGGKASKASKSGKAAESKPAEDKAPANGEEKEPKAE